MIQTYLNRILKSVYGKDVRQAIHDAIKQCYEDGKAGKQDLIARENISNLSNPNLLINSYFKDPVNQRGQTTYQSTDESSRVYSIDQWSLQNGAKLTLNDNTISIVGNSATDDSIFSQIIENPIVGDYVLQVKVASLNGTSNITIIDDNSSVISTNSLQVGVNEIKIKNNSIKIIQIKVGNGKEIKIEWIKLEQGALATPFVPKPRGEELIECYRFYYTFDSRLLISVYSATFADGNLYFPIKMRTTPKLDYSECTYFDPVHNAFLTPAKVELNTTYCDEKSATIKFTKHSNSTFNIGSTFNAKIKLCFSAEIN